MKIFSVNDLAECVAQLNELYPRPAMPPLTVSTLCDIRDPKSPWPHAELPGVYALFNDRCELVYVGKASCGSCLGYRVRAHFDKIGGRKADWLEGVRYMATIAGLDADRFARRSGKGSGEAVVRHPATVKFNA